MLKAGNPIRPPLLAQILLSLVSGSEERTYILGDLTEEFQAVAGDQGRQVASRWFWSQVIRSLGPLLATRLTSRRMKSSVGSLFVGLATAAIAASVMGSILEALLEASASSRFGVVALVVTTCSLTCSTCAVWISTWFSGAPYRWVLATICLFVVAPDILYAVGHRDAYPLTWLILLPSLATLATLAGLVVGGSLHRRIHCKLST